MALVAFLFGDKCYTCCMEVCENNPKYADNERFMEACRGVLGQERVRDGIGTLSEKTLHAVIKRFIEPDEVFHEVKIGRNVADVQNAEGIFEVQTRAFNKLRAKLEGFLEENRVTVVYPIPAEKRLIWINSETGELSVPRKSPKRGRCFDAFPELYKLGSLIAHPSLRILLLFIDLDEYRYLDGWSEDKKKGSTRCERIPAGLAGSLLLSTGADYAALLPKTLPRPFTTKDLAKEAKLRLNTAQVMLTVLTKRGAISCVGKSGRLKTYEVENFN